MVARQVVARRATLVAVTAFTMWALGIAGCAWIVSRTYGGNA